ncbi:MAG: septal ring lytic transglycosylase RlpA family protein [Candidatus Atribacteria bacterium]|nr:septal ring lytic transglycosylase RlpA family protein [Candidatus Atribacteria bacterium]MCD6349988.1 septal ring lytic transglycosylase RlpA family protein [Candidatus Atribacteria bacterium]
MRIRSAGHYKSIEERTRELVAKLERVLKTTFDQPPDFHLLIEGKSVKAFCNDKELFEVTREDARLNNSNLLDLAALWLNNFQIEFYCLRGYYYNPSGKVITGLASWYGPRFRNRTTSSGEVFNPYAFTCAHREFPFNTVLLVTNLVNGKQVVVRVNDRGPVRRSRVIVFL